ncbi:MAG: NUDIX hydrolase [Acidobacteriota bacterium]
MKGRTNVKYEPKDKPRNPFPTVDIIIEYKKGDKEGIILIKRKNPPYGWAIPGGFIEYGEFAENTAIREAKEETNLDIEILSQLHTYSNPERDPRHHTISVVFVARGFGTAKAKDDASEIGIFNKDEIPENLAFDHNRILKNYFNLKEELQKFGLDFSFFRKIFD